MLSFDFFFFSFRKIYNVETQIKCFKIYYIFVNLILLVRNCLGIYDIIGSTTGSTPVGPVIREPLPFPVLFTVQFLKPWYTQYFPEIGLRKTFYGRGEQNFTIKVNYFPLTKFSGVAKHLKMNYFPKNILR